MSATSRREVLKQARRRYGGRGKAGRSRLLDEICVLCGYERKYASKLLRGRRPIAGESGKCRGGSQRIYAAAEREVIKAIWLSAEQPCGKRLKAHCHCGCLFMRSVTAGWRARLRPRCWARARPPSTGCWRPAGSVWAAGVAAARVRAHCCAVRSPFAPSTGR